MLPLEKICFSAVEILIGLAVKGCVGLLFFKGKDENKTPS